VFSRVVKPSFNPASITGLLQWLDGADAATMQDALTGGATATTGTPVALWLDKSGLGNHQSQSVVNQRGLKLASGGVAFDQIDDGMASALLLALPYTIVVVSTEHAGSPNFWRVLTAPGPNNVLISVSRPANTVYVGGDIITAALAPVETEGVVALRCDASIATTVFFNGSAVTAVDTRNNWGLMMIGYPGAFGDPCNSDLREYLVWDHYLSDSDMANVNSYLIAKWGITP
jgi:hypothetical protein